MERDGSRDAVEHAGCGRRIGREQWEAGGDGIYRGSLAISSNKFTVAGNTGNTVVAGTLNAGGTLEHAEQPELGSCDASSTLDVTGATTQHGGGGDAERDGSCDAVEHAGCGRRRGREQWEVCGDGIGLGTLAISSNKFTVAGDTATLDLGILQSAAPQVIQPRMVYVTGDIRHHGSSRGALLGLLLSQDYLLLCFYRIGDSAPSDSLTVNGRNYTGTTTMSNTLDVR